MKYALLALYLLTVSPCFSDVVVKKFEFKGGDVDSLVNVLSDSLAESGVEVKVYKNYSSTTLQHTKISVADIKLSSLVETINEIVGYKLMIFNEEQGVTFYAKPQDYYSHLTREFELSSKVYDSVQGNKGALEALLQSKGIKFDHVRGYQILEITNVVPHTLKVRHSSTELELIEAVLTLLERSLTPDPK